MTLFFSPNLMPFTLTHPAAILPIFRWVKRRDLLLPLAIGAMMPDFGYYYTPFKFFNENAHTLVKSFTFCLPVGLIVFGLFYFLQTGWIAILPTYKSRLLFVDHLPEKLSLKFIALAVIAIVLGAWTHIIWDSFTHRNGLMLEYLPFLKVEVLSGIQLFRILQHASTLLGSIVLFNFYRKYKSDVTYIDRRSVIFICVTNIFSLIQALRIDPFQWFFFITEFFSTFFLISLFTAFVNTVRKRFKS